VKPQTRKHPTCGYFRSGPCRGSDTPANRPSSFAEVRTGFCTARTHVGSAEQIRVVELHLVGEDVCVYVFAVTARLRWPTFWPIVAHGTPARCKRLILRWRRSCGLNVGTPAAVQARLNRGAQPVRCHVLEHAPIRVAIVARAELEYLNRTTLMLAICLSVSRLVARSLQYRNQYPPFRVSGRMRRTSFG
jgi:hypothetical protein